MASHQYQHLVKTTALFFKPFHPESLTNKLMIPRNFVKKYGDLFSETVFLKLPNGEEWKVNVGRRNGDVWLEHGWREFAEYHSLFKGRLLVFGYDRSTSHRLDVIIMDPKTSEEIDYPSSTNGVKAKKARIKQEEESPSGTKKNNPPLPFLLQQHRKDRNLKRGHNVETTSYPQHAHSCHTRKNCKAGDQRGRFASKVLKVKGEVVESNRGRALERAEAFKSQSEYPSFVFVARPSYINNARMSIPLEFARKFLASKKRGQTTNLRTSYGRVWVAKFITRKMETRTRFELSKAGWNAFVKDNDLKVNDVCVFELIEGTTHELNFQVSIFRNTNHSDAHLSQETRKHSQKNKRMKIKKETEECQVPAKKPKFSKATSLEESSAAHSFNDKGTSQKCKAGGQRIRFNSEVIKVKGEVVEENRGIALERAKAFKSQSQYPSFIFVARPSYIKTCCQAVIPSEFAVKFLASKNCGLSTNLQTSNGRIWVAKFTARKQKTTRRFELSNVGWRAFVKDNDLKVDDVCVFELIKGATHELNFRVSIFRNTNPSDSHLSQGKITHKRKRVKIDIETEEFQVPPKKSKFTKATSAVESSAAHRFNSEKPLFKVTIGKSHAQAIPITFLRKYWKQGKHVVELMVRDRSRRVRLVRTCGSPDYGFFSEGWAAFARENDLQVGDECFFELVKRGHIHVMKVFIFKHSSP